MRRLARILLVAATLPVALIAAAVILSQTPWFRGWVRGVIEAQAGRVLNGQLSIGRVRGNLFTGIELEQVALAVGGQPAVVIDRALVEYDIPQVASRHIVVARVRLEHPVIHLRHQEGGWNLAHLKASRPPGPGGGPGRTVTLPDIQLTGGTFIVESPLGPSWIDVPRRLDGLEGRVAFTTAPNRYAFDIERLSFDGREPRLDVGALAGRITVTPGDVSLGGFSVRTGASSLDVNGVIGRTSPPSVDLQVAADPFSFPEFARLMPMFTRVRVEPVFRLHATGPLDRLQVDLQQMRSPHGDASGHVTVNLLEHDRPLAGALRIRRLDVAPFISEPAFATDVTGLARFDLSFPHGRSGTIIRGTYDLAAEEASAFGYHARQLRTRGRVDDTHIQIGSASAEAYGAAVTAAGTLDRRPAGGGRSALAYDLAGTVAHGDLREVPAFLPVPHISSRLDFDYHVTGLGGAAHGSGRFAPSVFAGATIGDGSTGTFAYDGETLRYTGAGHVADLDLQQLGREFDITALQADRFRSRINGTFDVSGAGTTLAALEIDASGRVEDAAVFGPARVPELTFSAHIRDRRLDVRAAGRAATLDPAIAFGYAAVSGSLTGHVDGRLVLTDLGGSEPAFPDRISLDGTVTLDASEVNGLRVDHAAFTGRYAARVTDVVHLDAAGLGVTVEASGRLALDQGGASTLSYRAEGPTLREIGARVGVPLTGSASAEGTITGNASNLRTTGTLRASRVVYSDVEALDLSSRFEAALPDLSVDDLRASAETTGTFVTVAGVGIREATLRTDYAHEQVAFEATLRDVPRSLGVAGQLTFHADRQEMRLQRLALDIGGQQWHLAAGSQATLERSPGAIAVRDVRLENGGQVIRAEGTLGRGGPGIDVTVTNVDLGDVDRLLLGNRGLAGRLDVLGFLSGSPDDPVVTADFSVVHGAVQRFRYAAFVGKLSYEDQEMHIDARLEERADAWIMVRGLMPAALLTASRVGAAQPVDLHVESNTLDLGFVQGFTDVVRDVGGTLQLNLQVTGTAGNPQLSGHVNVRDGAFTVVPTGVLYHSFEAGILFRPGQMIVEGFRMLDQHGAALSVGGTLGVRGRQVNEVNLRVVGRNFKVIENELADMQLNPDLGISGELDRPLIEGRIDVTAGTVYLDEIIVRATSSAYSTRPAGDLPAATPSPAGADGTPRPARAAPAGERSLMPFASYRNATIQVRLQIPDGLIMRAQDIRVGQSLIGLGAVNATFGGALRVEKKPGDDARLLGDLRTIRGSYDFQGRRFDILRDGRIRFEGLEPINPALDVTAQRVISGVEARVHVLGSLRAPELTLTSQPPLDQADILSLIVFNQPANELGLGQQASLAERASALATGFVASKLAESIGRALDLDVFEITTAAQAGGGQSATVTVGGQLGPRLYVKVRQGIGSEPVSQVVLDYRLTDHARIETTVSQGGTVNQSLFRRVERGAVDLIFFFSY